MPNDYAIIRIEKAKSMAAVKGKLDHILRNRETVNADPTKGITSLVHPPTFEEIKKRIESYMPRRNAVLAIEVIQTASPAFFKDKTSDDIFAWAEASLSWIQKTFGAEQVLCYCLHRDEQTYHTHSLIICEHEHKLNASHYIGGRKKLQDMWSSYAEAMQPFGLARGREYSPAEHHKIKEYYSNVNASYDELGQNVEKAVGEIVYPPVTVKDHVDPQAYAEQIVRDVIRKKELAITQLGKELETTRKDYDKLQTIVSDARKYNKNAGENAQQLKEYKQMVRDLTRQRRTAYQEGYAQAQAEGQKERENMEREYRMEKMDLECTIMKTRTRLFRLQDEILEMYRTQVPTNSPLRAKNITDKYFADYPRIRDGVKGVLGSGNKNTLNKGMEERNNV